MSLVWNSFKKYILRSVDTNENHGSCSSRKEIKDTEINLEHNQNLNPTYMLLDKSDKVDDERRISDSQKYSDEEFLDSIIDGRTNRSKFGHPVSESDLQHYENFRELVEEAGIADLDTRWIRNEKIEKGITNPDFCSLKEEEDAVDNLYNESVNSKGEEDSVTSSVDSFDDLENKLMNCVDERKLNNSSTGSYEEETESDKDDLRNIPGVDQSIPQDFSNILPDITSDESSEDESPHIVVAANKPPSDPSLTFSDLSQVEVNKEKVEEEFMELHKTMSHLSKEKWKADSSPRGRNMPELEVKTKMEIGQQSELDAQRTSKVRSMPEVERVEEDTQQSVKHPFISQGKSMPGLEDEMEDDLKSVGGTTFHTLRNSPKVRTEKQMDQELVNLSTSPSFKMGSEILYKNDKSTVRESEEVSTPTIQNKPYQNIANDHTYFAPRIKAESEKHYLAKVEQSVNTKPTDMLENGLEIGIKNELWMKHESINIPHSSEIDLKFSSTGDMETSQATEKALSTSRFPDFKRKLIANTDLLPEGTNSCCLYKKNTELDLENEVKIKEDSSIELEFTPNENDKTNKAAMLNEERVGKLLVNSASTTPIKKRIACENEVEMEHKSIPSTVNMGLLTCSYDGKKNQHSMDKSAISPVPEVRNEHNPKQHFVEGVHNSLHMALDLALQSKGECASKVPSISHLEAGSVSPINYNGKMNETFEKDMSVSRVRKIQEVNNTGAIHQQTVDEALRKNALKNGMTLGFQYKGEAKLSTEVISSIQRLEMGPEFSPDNVNNRNEESKKLYLSHRVQNRSEEENDFCNTLGRMLGPSTPSNRSLVSKSEMGTQFDGNEMLKADTMCNSSSISKAEMGTQTILKESIGVQDADIRNDFQQDSGRMLGSSTLSDKSVSKANVETQTVFVREPPRVQHADIVADFQQNSGKMLGSGMLSCKPSVFKADMETQTVFVRELPRGQDPYMDVDFQPASGRALESNRVELETQMNGRKMSGSCMLSNLSSVSKAEMETQTVFGTESPRVQYSVMKPDFEPPSGKILGPSSSSNKPLVSKAEVGTQVNEEKLLWSGTWPNQSSDSKAEMETQTTLTTESSRVKNPLTVADFQEALGRIFGLKTVPNFSSSSKAEMGTQTTFLTASPTVRKPEVANWNMTPATFYKKLDKFYVQEGLDSTMINKSPRYEYVIHVPIGSYSSEASSANSQINTTPNKDTKQIKKLLDVSLHSRLDFNPNNQQISKSVPKIVPSVGHASPSSIEGNIYLRKSGFNSAVSPQMKAGPSGLCAVSASNDVTRSKVASPQKNSSSTKPYYFICTTSTANVETKDSKVDKGTGSAIAVGKVEKVVNCIDTMGKYYPTQNGESYLEQNGLKMIQNDIVETKMVLTERNDKKISAKSLLSRMCAASRSSTGNGSVSSENKGKCNEKKNVAKVSQPRHLVSESSGYVHEPSINTSSSTVLKFSPEQLMNRTSRSGEEESGNQENVVTVSKPVAEQPTALSTAREEAEGNKNENTLVTSEPAAEQVINDTCMVNVDDDTVTSISIAAKAVEDQPVNQITRSEIKGKCNKQTKSSKVSKTEQKFPSSECSRKRKLPTTTFDKKNSEVKGKGNKQTKSSKVTKTEQKLPSSECSRKRKLPTTTFDKKNLEVKGKGNKQTKSSKVSKTEQKLPSSECSRKRKLPTTTFDKKNSEVKGKGNKQTKSSKVSKPEQKLSSSECSRKRKYPANFGKNKKMKVENDFLKPRVSCQMFCKNSRALRIRTSGKNYKT